MRVLQLIDSLDAGGAERMAVSIANGLCGYVDRSFLCATRKEGALKESILPEVGYLFLNRSKTLDVQAFKKLYTFVKNNRITILHAHSTSFFFACLLKLRIPSLKIIWHDHYGQSEQLEHRKFTTLKYCSRLFSAIISVNIALKEWSLQHLKCKRVHYLENFSVAASSLIQENPLKGERLFNIVCVANFRLQKDHSTLIKAFALVKKEFEDVALHLIGGHLDETYTNMILSEIKENKIKDIFVYGEQTAISSFLKYADLAVLSSSSEGLPVALLEYGMHKLPVVCTDVGDCKEVLAGNGYIVPPQDATSLAKGILTYIYGEETREKDARQFYEHVTKFYSIQTVLPKLLEIYNF